MKLKVFSLLFFLSNYFYALSQINNEITIVAGVIYKLNENLKVAECDAVGNPRTDSVILLQNWKVVVCKTNATCYVVRLLRFRLKNLNELYIESSSKSKEGSKKIGKASVEFNQIDAKKYYLIDKNDLEGFSIEYKSRNSFTMGIPTIPVKLRFGNNGITNDPRYFRFEGTASLGLSIGYKYDFKSSNVHYGINAITGFTVASVLVDSLTTKGKILSNTTVASFSPHLGLVFDFDRFQAGIYTGIDFLFGEPNSQWVYRNKPWLGLGIGISLFDIDNTGIKNQRK